jgi:tRNA threonylcarbamoyladenosine biosynthesis protein TsaB
VSAPRRVVAIDTAGPVVGVALWVDGEVLTREARVARGAEALLVPWVDALCAEAGFRPGDVDGVGVVNGPGAFTGLRVGLATAIGLALAADVPLWSEGSLHVRAAHAQAAAAGRPVLALLDARKERLYALVVDPVAGPVGQPADLAPSAAVAQVAAPFLATGEGAVVARAAVEAAGGEVWARAAEVGVDTLARRTAAALARGAGRRAVDVAPEYVRPPDARTLAERAALAEEKA